MTEFFENAYPLSPGAVFIKDYNRRRKKYKVESIKWVWPYKHEGEYKPIKWGRIGYRVGVLMKIKKDPENTYVPERTSVTIQLREKDIIFPDNSISTHTAETRRNGEVYFELILREPEELICSGKYKFYVRLKAVGNDAGLDQDLDRNNQILEGKEKSQARSRYLTYFANGVRLPMPNCTAAWITSLYNHDRRTRRTPGVRIDLNKSYVIHGGVDIGAAIYVRVGMPIYAVESGLVYNIGTDPRNPQGGWGLSVHIQHNNGHSSIYAHNNRVLPNVRKYELVDTGEQIAELGNTGFSRGNHLHFGISVGNNFLYSEADQQAGRPNQTRDPMQYVWPSHIK